MLTRLAAGCDSTDTEEGQTGSLQVLLTDASFPFDRVEAVNVAIERVEALTTADTASTGSDSLFVISDEEQSFNLLELRDGVTAPLASEELPAGTYQQIRLILGEEASVVMDDGTTYDLTVPSGTQTGVKVLLGACVSSRARSQNSRSTSMWKTPPSCKAAPTRPKRLTAFALSRW